MTYTPNPGDVFIESWGYDQTNINAWAVVRATTQTVWIKPCALERVGEGHSTRLRPQLVNGKPVVREFRETRSRVGKVLNDGSVRKLVKFTEWRQEPEPYLNLTTYSNGYLWDRESAFFDTIAAGYPGH